MPINNYGAILRSTDQGNHFQQTGNITPMGGNDMGRNCGERLMVDPNLGNKAIFWIPSRWAPGSSGQCQYRENVSGFPVTTTTDGVGIIFVNYIKSSGVNGMATPVIYAGVSRSGDTSLYVSADTGKTWKGVPGQPIDLMPMHMAIDQDTALYIDYSDTEGPYNVSTGKVWRYSIPKGIWLEITPTARYQGGFGGITVDPQSRVP